MTKEKSEPDAKIKVPDTLEEALEPLETSFGDLVRSLQPELEAKLDELLKKRTTKADSLQQGVIGLLASGVSHRETAELLDISKSTVWRVSSNSKFGPIIRELREVYARKVFQWAMSLLPWSFRAMYDNLTKGNLDQRRLAAQAMFKLVGEQLTSGAAPPPAKLPSPRAEEGAFDIFD